MIMIQIFYYEKYIFYIMIYYCEQKYEILFKLIICHNFKYKKLKNRV